MGQTVCRVGGMDLQSVGTTIGNWRFSPLFLKLQWKKYSAYRLKPTPSTTAKPRVNVARFRVFPRFSAVKSVRIAYGENLAESRSDGAGLPL